MDSQTKSALQLFASHPRVFSAGEVSDAVEVENDEAQNLYGVLRRDSRFAWLGTQPAPGDKFITKRTLFLWLASLSIRVSRDPQPLCDADLVGSMGLILGAPKMDALPRSVVRFAQRLGFLLPSASDGYYVLPYAILLSHAGAYKAAASVFERLADRRERTRALSQPLVHWIDEALASLPERSSYIVRSRQGLIGEAKRKTLEETGVEWGVTRERVRQIEAKAWKRLRHPSRLQWLLLALVSDRMKTGGSLLDDVSSPGESLRAFIAEILDIPRSLIPHLGVAVWGVSEGDIGNLKTIRRFPDDLDASICAGHLAKLCPHLARSDVEALAAKVTLSRRGRLTGGQRIYLTLKSIGQPAHYSQITHVYNSLFPNSPMDERNVHAALGREYYGVVWIGVRGCYALTEWGYEKPEPIFDQVAEIVARRFQETGQPVPFTVIASEIGRYRKMVNPNSLTLATQLNPRLEKLAGDRFVPKSDGSEAEAELDANQLDSILKRFEKQLPS